MITVVLVCKFFFQPSTATMFLFLSVNFVLRLFDLRLKHILKLTVLKCACLVHASSKYFAHAHYIEGCLRITGLFSGGKAFEEKRVLPPHSKCRRATRVSSLSAGTVPYTRFKWQTMSIVLS